MKKQRLPRPAETLRRLGCWASNSIGQMEALAGINVQCHTEREALWSQFRHLYTGDTEKLLRAVMDHCATITLDRIKRGELALLPTRM